MRTLASADTGRDNNFNLIRMIAASAVLVSHSYPIALGQGSREPLEELFGFTLGTLAVFVFFAVSGYFIASSFARRRDIWSFVAARIARIYPGLLVVLLLTVVVLGPVFTSLPIGAYASDPHTWAYLPRNLSLRFLQYELPGVFAANSYVGAINGSLWTLFWEVACYAMVVAVGFACGGRRGRFAVFLAGYLVAEGMALWLQVDSRAVELSFPFVAGMAFHAWRDQVPLRFWICLVLGVIAMLAKGSFLALPTLALALAYAVLWLGHVQNRALLAYNRLGDYSYGMYVYAFPVQQALAASQPGVTPTMMTSLAFPITLVLAIASWHFVEHPSLDRRENLARLLRRLVRHKSA